MEWNSGVEWYEGLEAVSILSFSIELEDRVLDEREIY